MQVIYNYIPETNHVSWVHSVAAILYLQFVLHVIPLNMFYTFTLALSVVCVQCLVWRFFCSPLILCFIVVVIYYQHN